MKKINMRPVDIERDFAMIAELFSIEQKELTTREALIQDYQDHKERIFRLVVAVDEQENLVGFNWGVHSRLDRDEAYAYVIVENGNRGKGIGGLLYADLDEAARNSRVNKLVMSVRDDCGICLEFAKKKGFEEKSHYVGLELSLESFERQRYEPLIIRLKEEGFEFTSMEALGNTEEMQHKLYLLNDSTSMELILPEAYHSWLDFKDFQKKVCGADWYKPDRQMIAIDTHTGDWAAMSAITRFEGADNAYSLHTGVDQRYHGRGLAEAVLVQALDYARNILKVPQVIGDEDAKNESSLAILTGMGFVKIPGSFRMEKKI